MAQTPNYGFILGPEPPLPLKKIHYDYNWNLVDNELTNLSNKVDSNRVNVRDFGAVGDGIADDTTAIQNAVNSLSSGDILYFPSGTYLITTTINFTGLSNIEIRGTGNSTILAQGFNGHHFVFDDCQRMRIVSLKLQGEGINSANSVGGIWFKLTNNSNNPHHVLEYVEIDGVTNNGITMAVPILVNLKNVKVINVSGDCFNFYNGTSVHLDTCYAITSTQAGFKFSNMTYCTLSSCAAEVNGIGYQFVNSKSIVCNGCGSEDQLNRSTSYPGYAYQVDGLKIVLNSCYARNSGGGHISEINGGKAVLIDFFDGDTFSFIPNSGLDADTVDGYQTATTSSPNVIPVTDVNGQLDRSFIPPFGATGFKNRIINGDFAVWQRGTSFTVVGYTVDRWRYDTDTDDAVSISQVATAGGEPFTAQYYARVGLTAGTTGTFNKFATRLEFPKLYFGKTVTLSFWAKADVATTVTVKLAFVFSGTEYNPVSQTVNIGTSWQRHTVTFTLGTPTGFTESGSDYLDVALLLPVNTTVTVDVANVQLEEGDTATDFEYVPFDVQLLRCMRYYEKRREYLDSPVGSTSARYMGSSYSFTAIKRAAPSILTKDRLGTQGAITIYTSTGGVVDGETSFSIGYITKTEFWLWTAQGLNIGGLEFYWTADAEL